MKKVADFIDSVALIISSVAIAGAAVVIIVQIIARYFFQFSFVFGEELPRYLMVCGIFIGASCAVKRAKMANISILTSKLPPKGRDIIAIIAGLFGIFFLVMVIYFGMKQILSPFVFTQKSPAMRVPMWIPYLCIPLGAFFMMVHLLEDIVDRIVSFGRAGQ